MAFCGRSSETGVGNGKEQREFIIDATWLYRVCVGLRMPRANMGQYVLQSKFVPLLDREMFSVTKKWP